MSFSSCLRPLCGCSQRAFAWRGLGLVLAVVVLGGGPPAVADYIFIDLHPSGFTDSRALAVSDGQQVGYTGTPPPHERALLWTGSPDSVVDLTPSGFTYSRAAGVSGGQQVGSGITGDQQHALLWTGSADSVVDLHPSGFTSSAALGISDGQQVGRAGTPPHEHALLWTGSADSVVDLHPSGFTSSLAVGVSAGQQVGYGTDPDGFEHALLWTGSADSVVDLHTFLPPEFTESQATGIDADGNIVGRASGRDGDHAFLLIPD